MGRSMKTYPVHETEMNSISLLNTGATLFFTLAGIPFGIAMSIWISAAFNSTQTQLGTLCALIVAPILLIFAVVFFVLGCTAWLQRRNLWSHIKSESAPMNVEVTSASVSMTSARRRR